MELLLTSKSLSEITQQAIVVLTKEIGIVDMIRFLNQFTMGYGDYTEERKVLFGGLTLDEILSAMKRASGHQNA
jgi:hypothetical protein